MKRGLLIATGVLFLVLAVGLVILGIALLRAPDYFTGFGLFFLFTAAVTGLAGLVLIRRERRRRRSTPNE